MRGMQGRGAEMAGGRGTGGGRGAGCAPLVELLRVALGEHLRGGRGGMAAAEVGMHAPGDAHVRTHKRRVSGRAAVLSWRAVLLAGWCGGGGPASWPRRSTLRGGPARFRAEVRRGASRSIANGAARRIHLFHKHLGHEDFRFCYDLWRRPASDLEN